MNVDSLWRKRVNRLGIKAPTHSGQRRIFFVLDRATRKFHGDIGLWMQYIEYARRRRAHKKLAQILTSVLRLHPQRPELWIYAAKFVVEEHSDMTEARSYMQQGLRFCKRSKNLWLEYAKLEMVYIGKIAARRRILGLGKGQGRNIGKNMSEPVDNDLIALPEITEEDINPDGDGIEEANEVTLRKLESIPVFSGAIPMAVFDAAHKQFDSDIVFERDFYQLFAQFDEVPCLGRILNHVVASMLQSSPDSHHTQICHIRVHVEDLEPGSAAFPARLQASLSDLRSRLSSSKEQRDLALEAARWLTILSRAETLDTSLKKVLALTLRDCVRVFEDSLVEGADDQKRAEMASLLSVSAET